MENNYFINLRDSIYKRIDNPVFREIRPISVHPSDFDSLLADGWWNYGDYFCRHNFTYFKDTIVGILPLRLPVREFEPSKSLRKILKMNQDLRVQLGPLKFDERKQEIFDLHWQRFDFLPPQTIDAFVSEDPIENLCAAGELEIYLGEKLIACSYFYLGEESMASISCIFDPEYHKRSLGIFTMLKEVQLCINNGYEYYYPGYCHDVPSEFDYKKRLKPMEWYDFDGNWRAF